MSLRANVVANYVGQGCAALMGVVFLPIYARALGVEAYGLVGVFSVLQASMSLMDLGLTPAVSREMARYRAGVRSPEWIRDLLRSLERTCGVIACVVIASIYFGASWFAAGWLKPVHLQTGIIESAVQIMALALALRWLEQLYKGALQGLEDLVWLNAAQIVLATIRWGGAYLVLRRFPSVVAFFTWQATAACVSVVVLIGRAYAKLPKLGRAARFSWKTLTEIRGFAGGMFFGAVLSFLLTQFDKIVISKLLPLDSLGSYMLATNASMGLLQLVVPLSMAVYPRLTALAARNEAMLLEEIYLRACAWMAVLVVPASLVLALFSGSVLLMWTGSPELASTVAPLLTILALGTLCNGLMNLPYFLQLARGWPGLAVRINLVAVAVTVPATILAVRRFGAIGAAYVWLLLNVAYVIVTAHFMHRRILPGAKWRWYANAVVRPLAIGTVVAIIAKAALPVPLDRGAAAVETLGVGLLLTVCVAAALPQVRRDLCWFLANARERAS
jgi:O-antigen/teichoic acid export membrane protein